MKSIAAYLSTLETAPRNGQSNRQTITIPVAGQLTAEAADHGRLRQLTAESLTRRRARNWRAAALSPYQRENVVRIGAGNIDMARRRR